MIKKLCKFALPLFIMGLLASCNKNPMVEYTVTFYDGETVLREVVVEDGNLVVRPTDLEVKQDYVFVDWFATPSKNHIFDFSVAITKDEAVYAGFSRYQADTRDWYILGNGQGEVLKTSNWGNVIGDPYKLTKSNNSKNEFTMTVDLYVGDEFQFGGPNWIHKRGQGYLKNMFLNDEQVFDGTGGGYGEVAAKGRNIKVLVGGKYRFTLTTFPADDTYNTSDPSYTEANKEIYNVGTYDYIEWERLGDATPLADYINTWYVKGKNITNWTNLHTRNTVFIKTPGVSEYKKDIYLIEGDEIMFASFKTIEGVEQTAQFLYVNRDNAAENSNLDVFAGTGSNFVISTTGTYSIIINDADESKIMVTASLDESIIPDVYNQKDFYVDGSFVTGGAWSAVTSTSVKSEYKMTKVAGKDAYEYKGIFSIGDEMIIRMIPEGATSGEGHLSNSFNYKSAITSSLISAANADGGNYNIKILNDGEFKITFDLYQQSIKVAEDGNNVYIKGSFNNMTWNQVGNPDYLFAPVSGNPGLYLLEVEITSVGEFGLDVADLGVTTGGQWVGKDRLGDDTATGLIDVSGGNAKFTVTGTHYFVYDALLNIFNVYLTSPY